MNESFKKFSDKYGIKAEAASQKSGAPKNQASSKQDDELFTHLKSSLQNSLA